MVYVNKGGQSREQTMVAAYALVTKYGANQQHLAKALGCSQATISSWVKEMTYKEKIKGLGNELDNAQEYIQSLHNELDERYMLENQSDERD